MSANGSMAERYNTQELLSMNMDRLKEYMDKLGRTASQPGGAILEEARPPKTKSATRIRKTPSACRVLAVFENPHGFVHIMNENDRREPRFRYGLERASAFNEAVNRMIRHRFDLVLVSPMRMVPEDIESPLTTVDWILLLRGLAPPKDMYFLAKKRWFVMNFIPGSDNQEKVGTFRRLKDAYRKTPVVFLHERGQNVRADVLAHLPRTRVLGLLPGEADPLFSLLDTLTLG